MSIRVGGVPEHFNLPWRMAATRSILEKHGAQVAARGISHS